MTKTKTALAAIALVALPSVLSAECFGSGHEQASMSCAAGTVWDTETRTCVPSTS